MVHKCLFSFFSTILACSLSGQKPMVDSLAISQWPVLENNAVVSSNGNYFAYTIRNKPLGGQTLIVQSTTSSWKKEVVGVSRADFSIDEKQVVYMSNDTLYFLRLGAEGKRLRQKSLHISSLKKRKENGLHIKATIQIAN